MVFSSLIFLFLFLPVVLAVYYLIGKKFQNAFLLAASLFFYTWGEGLYVFIMLISIACNYPLGILIDRFHGRWQARPVMAGALIFNISLLGFYKYANFLAENLNNLLHFAGIGPLAFSPVHLPIGISFYTFHTMSYLIDVHRRIVKAQKNPADFALYVSLFPQLVAGPIIRYHDVADQIASRLPNLDGFVTGIKRFIIGLGKKTLIANTLALTVDQIFSLPSGAPSTGLAWLGIICYTLQIYFDFSGYSDMAIGLGRMFGFRFLENFDYPYIAKSVREFWRRWHISLSNWFRDYLYIPLGGNRNSVGRTYFNLVLVFFLCGLWHGAKWNFVIWGMLHGAFLVLERTSFGSWLDRRQEPFKHFYTLAIVIVGWVFFRADTLAGAVDYLSVMGGAHRYAGVKHTVSMYMTPELLLAILAGIAGSMPLRSMFAHYFASTDSKKQTMPAVAYGMPVFKGLGLSLVFIASVMSLASGTYNPFIYFRF